ncbi:conserved hypothetical protein [Hyella patelloides LEGE 07179]|uniref:Sulfotransferase domain-containing protein n=1 Tax=Hyella patelloides LEGE 07179 TaxID=945734 RepID=A0A563VYB0_9CYAN|nr:sulfotransferase domain-containing protein [Hyella patelloides]VEP16411.1 conserved hypothetical protein [Hyella patelloides LEGE 07179]
MSEVSEVTKKLPSFLGIGAMRSGTTWLDNILRSHPDIYLPERRKEIHFFDLYYDKGINWYQDFFPTEEQRQNYQQIGEITPAYLYLPEIPSRIKDSIPNCRFLVILRNPVDRAYSHYGFWVKNSAEKRAFEDLLEQEPEIIGKGMYYQQFERYLQHFPRESFLVLIFEEITQNPLPALEQLSKFLAVDSHKFDLSTTSQKKNASASVLFPQARALACKFRDFLRNNDIDWLWNLAKSSGVNQIFETTGKPLPPLNREIRAKLIDRYSSDVSNLEKLLDIDFSLWKY